MTAIRPGQIYEAVKPNPADPHGTHRRILVKGHIPYGAGCWGQGTANVVTLTDDGREVRPRSVKLDQFHETATTRTGEPRRNGYVLVQDAGEQS